MNTVAELAGAETVVQVCHPDVAGIVTDAGNGTKSLPLEAVPETARLTVNALLVLPSRQTRK